jgi:hypothetical protein
MINGHISEFIRSSYFGGNRDIFVKGDERLVKNGYLFFRIGILNILRV